MSNSTRLLRSFIAQSLFENRDREEEIMNDFLRSDMYEKIARLIENFQYKILESKDAKDIINSPRQVNAVHFGCRKYFRYDDIASASEMGKRYDALHKLSRVSNSKNFHEREKSIHEFLRTLGIALEATPFLFILIYLFNSNNPALIEWCNSADSVTMAEGFIAFMSMFLFGEKLRSTQQKKAKFHKDASEFYAGEEVKAREELAPYLSPDGRFSLKK